MLAGTGGMLEFYDFILYILFSDQIAKAFFANIQSPFIKNLIVMLVFSIAYIVRPIGGVLIGWMGDTIGRKKSFSFTILLMGVCVFFMGVMPTYASIGLAAPIVFVCLRVVQGLALGGELPGAIVFVYESVEKRGVALGILFGMVFCGFLLGNIMSVVIHKFFSTYAWRVAFISGSIVAFIGYYIRQKLEETKMFRSLETKQKFPLLQLLRHQLRQQIGAILCVILVAFDGVMILLYFPKYFAAHLHYSHADISLVFIIISIVNVLVLFAASVASDYINYRKLYTFAAVFLVVIVYPAFYILSKGGVMNLLLGAMMVSIAPSIITGIFMRIICEAFTTDVRFSGVAIGYNLAFALVGGCAPVASELMTKDVGVIYGPVMVSITCGIIGILAMYLLKPSRLRKDIIA